MYIKIIKKLSKQDLIEIGWNLERWGWDERLGDKPDGWDSMPDYLFNNPSKIMTKREFIQPITTYIENNTKEKKRFKYHHLNHCNMTRLQHEIWWIKDYISKFLKIGFYSNKNTEKMVSILKKITNKNQQEWVHNTYYNN